MDHTPTLTPWTPADTSNLVAGLEDERRLYERLLEVARAQIVRLPGLTDAAQIEAMTEEKHGLMALLAPVHERLAPLKHAWREARGGLPQAVVAQVQGRLSGLESLLAEVVRLEEQACELVSSRICTNRGEIRTMVSRGNARRAYGAAVQPAARFVDGAK